MFGSVLATVNESLTTPRPATQVSWIFHAKPVILLTSVAMAIEPLALASDGGLSCDRPSTVCDCGPDTRCVVPPLRVTATAGVGEDLLAALLLTRARRPDPPEDAEADQQYEHHAGRPGDGDADDAVGGGV